MNFLMSQSSLEILIPDFQNGAIKPLPIQLVMRLNPSHYQKDKKQLINKPTHIINNSFSWIDLIFCNSQKQFKTTMLTYQYLKNVITISILEKLTLTFPFLLAVFVGCKITVRPTLKTYKRLFYFLTGRKLLKIFVNEKVNLLNQTLLNIFQNYIPKKNYDSIILNLWR